MRTARDVMTRNPRTVTPDTSVWDALAIMRQEEIRHLPVMRERRLVGVLSNRDYRRIFERTRPDGSVRGVFDIRVSEIMSTDGLVTARPERPVRELARLIVDRKVGCIPIVARDGRLLGIVTQKDVLASVIGARPRTRARAR